MALDFFIESLTINNGDLIPIEQNGIYLIVGPNNSGKSSLLREIYNDLNIGSKSAAKLVLNEIKTNINNSEEEFLKYINSRSRRVKRGNRETLIGYQIEISEQDAINQWRKIDQQGFNSLINFFCFLVNTRERLDICNPANIFSTIYDQPSHPIHVLKKYQKEEDRFSRYCQKAFGKELIVNHNAGGNIPLHIGHRPPMEPGEDRVSDSYLQKLVEIPFLENQGDGIKSFIGCLLATLIERRFVSLIDEPEAFLHPPQAKLIGYLLAKEHKGDGQFIIATHSSDLLKGMLEAKTKKLHILRITRTNQNNKIKILSSSDIQKFWSDPVLRFSNALDGIFHEGVVVCEDDADCRFYSAVLEVIINEVELKNVDKDPSAILKFPDYLFLASGGKSKIPKITKALKGLDVKIKVIADFDLLSNKTEFETVIQCLGGVWDTFKSDYEIFQASINQATIPLNKEQVIEKIKGYLDSLQTEKKDEVPEEIKEGIKAMLKETSPWYHPKRSGKESIPGGEPSQALDKLMRNSKKIGLWIVPRGEMESFCRTVPGKGWQWVSTVLENDLLADKALEDARKFIEEALIES